MASTQPTHTARRAIRATGPGPGREALRTAYLDLLKLSLCDLVGAGTRTVTSTGDGRPFTRELVGDQIEWRVEGTDWPENALTMVGLVRLDDLQRCVESVLGDGIDGDLVEVGAWRGGASILMRATLDAYGADDRTVCVADSFQGFPLPEPGGDSDDRKLDRELSAHPHLVASLDDVKAKFVRFGCEEGVEFVPGFFEETMPGLRGRPWSVVRLDGDTYKTTRLALDNLYPSLSTGGYVIIDEYHHPYAPMCRRAVDDFRREHAITEPMERIDVASAKWRRQSEPTRSSADAPPRPVTSSTRAAPSRAATPIPTARELQLTEEVTALRERLRTSEADLERLRGSPLAGPAAWARRKAQRG